jgi:hypothetical protein
VEDTVTVAEEHADRVQVERLVPLPGRHPGRLELSLAPVVVLDRGTGLVEAGVEVVAEVAAARGVPRKRPANPRLERPLAASEVDGSATTMNTGHGLGW